MTHDERVYHHMYETNEGIAEHAERIASLEELVRDMWDFISKADRMQWPEIADRMRELEVGHE